MVTDGCCLLQRCLRLFPAIKSAFDFEHSPNTRIWSQNEDRKRTWGRQQESSFLSEHQDTRQLTFLSLFLPRQLWRCFHMASAQSIFFFHSPFQCIKRAAPWNSIWGVEMIKNLPRLGPQWLRVHSGKWTTCRPQKLKNIDKLRTVSTAAVQETRETFSSLLKYFTELSFKKNK